MKNEKRKMKNEKSKNEKSKNEKLKILEIFIYYFSSEKTRKNLPLKRRDKIYLRKDEEKFTSEKTRKNLP